MWRRFPDGSCPFFLLESELPPRWGRGAREGERAGAIVHPRGPNPAASGSGRVVTKRVARAAPPRFPRFESQATKCKQNPASQGGPKIPAGVFADQTVRAPLRLPVPRWRGGCTENASRQAVRSRVTATKPAGIVAQATRGFRRWHGPRFRQGILSYPAERRYDFRDVPSPPLGTAARDKKTSFAGSWDHLLFLFRFNVDLGSGPTEGVLPPIRFKRRQDIFTGKGCQSSVKPSGASLTHPPLVNGAAHLIRPKFLPRGRCWPAPAPPQQCRRRPLFPICRR